MIVCVCYNSPANHIELSNLTPSFSIVTHPSETISKSIFNISSSNRFISSICRMPRCALASSPGEKTVSPVFMLSSMSTVPTRLSSLFVTKQTCSDLLNVY